MATNSLQSLNYRHHHNPTLGRRQSLDSPPLSFTNNLNTKNTNINNNKTLTLKTFSLSSSTTSTSDTTSTPDKSSTSLDLLERLLSASDFREADNETRRLLIALAGESAVKRGYVFFSEVQFISESDLKAIDELWLKHSNNKFGYSVQKKIFEKSDKDFTRFFIKAGWMKKLDTEVVQYNYRAFPDEFIWELNDDTPEGHLPLTNALRGTQLLKCIFSHPAFATEDDESEDEEESVGLDEGKDKQKTIGKGLFKGLFKTNYSF